MSTTKRKSLTTTAESYLYRRTSERRYRNQRPSLTSQPSSDTWMPTRTITPEDEDEEMPLKGVNIHINLGLHDTLTLFSFYRNHSIHFHGNIYQW